MSHPSRDLAEDYSERADAYARHWAPVIHPMASPLLSAMPLAGARRILDVGAGTGGLWPLVRQAAPRAEIWGMDRAEGMLRAGGPATRRRVAVMDARQLGFRAGAFDTALLVFMLFHVPEPVAALREVRSVVETDGHIGVAVWGADPGMPGIGVWTEELDRAGAAPDPRDAAVMQQALMDTPGKLRALLADAGLPPDEVWSRRFVYQWTAERLAETQTSCGPASRRLPSLPAQARRDCLHRVRVRLDALTPRELAYEIEVIYAIARARSEGKR